MLWKANPTFYPSPKLAEQAPHEKLAYVATFNPRHPILPSAKLAHARRKK
jgi:selenium-binding protein 1